MLKDIFKNLRESLSWSQQQLADKSNMSIATIWTIEKGDRPSKKVLTKLLNAFCLNIDDLLADPSLTDEDRIYLENKKCERLFYGRTL